MFEIIVDMSIVVSGVDVLNDSTESPSVNVRLDPIFTIDILATP